MNPSDDHLQQLVDTPSERRNVEYKRWIDPADDHDKGLIVRACLAMRNNNGGYLVVGFNDDGSPDTENVPCDVTASFHADVVQELVSKFASHAFDVTVEFKDRDGQKYPILCVPSGIETPVCAKSIVPHPEAGKTPLVEPDAVYVRSVTSNNRVSTTKARREDWDRLVRICFENREANIGAFVRRHLIGVDPKVLLDALSQIASAAPAVLKQPSDLVAEFEAESLKRLELVVAERSVKLPDCGLWHVSAVLSGDVPRHEATEQFLRRLDLDMPAHSGWTPWVVLLGSQRSEMRPYTIGGVWEQFAFSDSDFIMDGSLDFWRISPAGLFFHLRGLEDDFIQGPRNIPPRTLFDFDIPVWRIVEVFSALLSFGESMECSLDEVDIHCQFLWKGLAGRTLTAWSNPSRFLRNGRKSRSDDCRATVALPLSTPRNGIAPFVEQAVRPLFASFEGFSVESKVIEDLVEKVLASRF